MLGDWSVLRATPIVVAPTQLTRCSPVGETGHDGRSTLELMLVCSLHPKANFSRIQAMELSLRSLGWEGYNASAYSLLANRIHYIVHCAWSVDRPSLEEARVELHQAGVLPTEGELYTLADGLTACETKRAEGYFTGQFSGD